MEPSSAPPRAPGGGRRGSRPPARNGQELRAYARERLIESRLTPNAISLTGFALCVVAAVLVWTELWIPGGLSVITVIQRIVHVRRELTREAPAL